MPGDWNLRFAIRTGILTSLLVLTATPSMAVAYKCDYAKTKVENCVCRNKVLRPRDEKMFKLFGGLLSLLGKSEEREKALTEQLNAQNQFEKTGCDDVSHLKDQYDSRNNQLEQQLSKATGTQ